jgi:hypothetical protein
MHSPKPGQRTSPFLRRPARAECPGPARRHPERRWRAVGRSAAARRRLPGPTRPACEARSSAGPGRLVDQAAVERMKAEPARKSVLWRVVAHPAMAGRSRRAGPARRVGRRELAGLWTTRTNRRELAHRVLFRRDSIRELRAVADRWKAIAPGWAGPDWAELLWMVEMLWEACPVVRTLAVHSWADPTWADPTWVDHSSVGQAWVDLTSAAAASAGSTSVGRTLVGRTLVGPAPARSLDDSEVGTISTLAVRPSETARNRPALGWAGCSSPAGRVGLCPGRWQRLGRRLAPTAHSAAVRA